MLGREDSKTGLDERLSTFAKETFCSVFQLHILRRWQKERLQARQIEGGQVEAEGRARVAQHYLDVTDLPPT